MAINLMQGALTAVILQPRKLPSEKVVAAAAMSAVTPGLLGLLLPLLLVKNDKAAAPPPPSTDPKRIAVPDVVGVAKAEALERLKAAGLTGEVYPGNETGRSSGVVFKQGPIGGTQADKDSKVLLLVQVDAPTSDTASSKRA